MNTATRTLQPGTLVRLTLDVDCSAPGIVTAHDHIRGVDHVEFVEVDFHPDTDESATVTLPVTILTALCSWSESYADEYAMACDDALPGVTGSIDVDCQHDATKVFRWVDQTGSCTELFCTEHALTASLDAQHDHLPYEVDDLTD